MTKHGMDHEMMSKKMRLLTLVSMGQEHKEMTYIAVAKALSVDVDQVAAPPPPSLRCIHPPTAPSWTVRRQDSYLVHD